VITVKVRLLASLRKYLPPNSSDGRLTLELPEGTAKCSCVSAFRRSMQGW
jgi:hypothetical protein